MGTLWKLLQGKKRHIGAALVLITALLQFVMRKYGIDVPDLADDPAAVSNLLQSVGVGVYGVGVIDRIIRWVGTGK